VVSVKASHDHEGVKSGRGSSPRMHDIDMFQTIAPASIRREHPQCLTAFTAIDNTPPFSLTDLRSFSRDHFPTGLFCILAAFPVILYSHPLPFAPFTLDVRFLHIPDLG
jgi:hypothetical protein